jgi:putative tryptophan/tyrosine transport system substrate-binding protein
VTAAALGLEVFPSTCGGLKTSLAFEANDAESPYVIADPLASTNRICINTLALGVRLPTMYTVREFVEARALMFYGANLPDLYRRAADYVDKILRGTKPGAIPVEHTKFDPIII